MSICPRKATAKKISRTNSIDNNTEDKTLVNDYDQFTENNNHKRGLASYETNLCLLFFYKLMD